MHNSVFPCLWLLFLVSCDSADGIAVAWERSDIEFESFESTYLTSEAIDRLPDHQNRSFYHSFLGHDRRANEAFDLNCSPLPDLSATDSLPLSFVPALDYLLERARGERLIIINEAHHLPEHRRFTASLLPELREMGFTHLGLEALDFNYFSARPSSEPGFPFYYSGYYAREPAMAQLMRRAIAVGMSVFPYEGSGQSGAEREAAQARNVADYLGRHPDAKVILHCGYFHAREGKMNDYWVRSMAGRVHDLTGIDPFTIDQTLYRQRSDPRCERHIFRNFTGDVPSVVLRSDGKRFADSDTAWMDAYVLHPRFRDPDADPGLENLRIRLDNLDLRPPILLRSYNRPTDYATAVPDNVTEVTNNNFVHLSSTTQAIIAEDTLGNQRIALIPPND